MKKIIINEECKTDLKLAQMLEEITRQIHSGNTSGYNPTWSIEIIPKKENCICSGCGNEHEISSDNED